MAFLAAAVPAAIGAIGSGVTAVGGPVAALSLGATALSTVGTGMQAISEARAANYNADVNVIQARQAQEQAALKASELTRRNRQVGAAARAGAQENGFDLGGSIADVLSQAERQGQLDVLSAVYDGSVQAAGLYSEAKMNRRRAGSAVTAGIIGMGSQVLGGVSNLYGRQTQQLRA